MIKFSRMHLNLCSRRNKKMSFSGPDKGADNFCKQFEPRLGDQAQQNIGPDLDLN